MLLTKSHALQGCSLILRVALGLQLMVCHLNIVSCNLGQVEALACEERGRRRDSGG